MTLLRASIVAEIEPVDLEWYRRARAYHDTLTKPPGSLGRLEEIGSRLCGIQRRMPPTLARARVVVFAADHGVAAEESVTPYPQAVTGQMVANFARGGAAINAIAGVAAVELCVIDIGVAHPVTSESTATSVHRRAIASGTRNIAAGPAMTHEEVDLALAAGVEVAEECAAFGFAAVALGEMGIGNSTVASAITGALTWRTAAQVTGRGTGADDATLARKIAVVERALAVNQPDPTDGLDVLRKVGGLEIAGLCGLCLGLARRRIAIVSDGFIATAAAALATRIQPATTGYLFAGHLSPEPGHRLLLRELGLEPLLDLGMRLGEGTGATLSLSVLRAAAAVLTEMATFEQAGVADRSG